MNEIAKMPKDVVGIVKIFLEENGFDGLANEYGECGCLKDDLAPCDSDVVMDCNPGYRIPCTGPEDCPADGDCDWHITTEKPPLKESVSHGNFPGLMRECVNCGNMSIMAAVGPAENGLCLECLGLSKECPLRRDDGICTWTLGGIVQCEQVACLIRPGRKPQ